MSRWPAVSPVATLVHGSLFSRENSAVPAVYSPAVEGKRKLVVRAHINQMDCTVGAYGIYFKLPVNSSGAFQDKGRHTTKI